MSIHDGFSFWIGRELAHLAMALVIIGTLLAAAAGLFIAAWVTDRVQRLKRALRKRITQEAQS